MDKLPNLRFVEEYDIRDPSTKHSPYAYVGDVVEEIRLSYAVNEITQAAAQAVSEDQLAAISKLRDELCPEAKIEWFIVVCSDLERNFPTPPATPPVEEHAGRHWMQSEYSPAVATVPKRKKSFRRLNSIGRRKDREQKSPAGDLPEMVRSMSLGRSRKSSESTQRRPVTSTSTLDRRIESKSDYNLASDGDGNTSPAPVVPRVSNGNHETDKRESRLRSVMRRIF